MSDNWVVQNLQNALDTWNKYLTEGMKQAIAIVREVIA